MRKIGIDARGLNEKRTGILTYIEEILRKVNDTDDEDTVYYLYSDREIKLDFKLNKNIVLKEHREIKRLGSLWFYFKLPKILKQDGIDTFWGTQYYLPKRNMYSKNIKYILTIYDLAVKKLKVVGSWKTTLKQKIFLDGSVKNADKIIAISEATKNDIIECYNFNKEDEKKIVVTYLGTNAQAEYDLTEDEEKKIKDKFEIKDTPYLFFLSTIEPRKNIETLIKAFEYVKKDRNLNLKLILARRTWLEI